MCTIWNYCSHVILFRLMHSASGLFCDLPASLCRYHSSSILCIPPPIRACTTSPLLPPPKWTLNPSFPSTAPPWRWRRSWASVRGCWGSRWWTATLRTPICPAASTLLIWWLWALAARWVLASTCSPVLLLASIQVRLVDSSVIEKSLGTPQKETGSRTPR